METRFIILITGVNKKERLKPAIAVAEILKRRGITCVFAVINDAVITKALENRGYETVIMKKFVNAKGFLGKILKSLQRSSYAKEAARVLTTKNVKAVLSLGGIASVPVLDAAIKMNLKVFLLEVNAVISEHSMEFLSYAHRIYLPFTEMLSGLDRSKAIVTGIPVDREILMAEKRNIPTNKKLLVIFTCRVDSRSINELIRSMLRKYPEMRKEFFILQETGEKDVASVQRFYDEIGVEALCYMQYENRGKYYKTADMVICRPTSDVVAELLAMHKPGIFLPLPEKYDEYQKANAVMMNRKETGYLVEDTGSMVVRTKKLYSVFNTLFNSKAKVQQNIDRLEFEKSASRVAEDIDKFLSGRN